MPSNYNLRIKLTKFLGSRIIDVEDEDGILEKGVFIPLNMNGLHITKKGNVNAYAYVMERVGIAIDGSSHYIRLSVPKDSLISINKLGYDLPYIGELTPIDHITKYQLDKMRGQKAVKVCNIKKCEENEYIRI